MGAGAWGTEGEEQGGLEAREIQKEMVLSDKLYKGEMRRIEEENEEFLPGGSVDFLQPDLWLRGPEEGDTVYR